MATFELVKPHRSEPTVCLLKFGRVYRIPTHKSACAYKCAFYKEEKFIEIEAHVPVREQDSL